MNVWFNRPELKPHAAMVPSSERKEIVSTVNNTMLERSYMNYKNKKASSDMNKSSWYRYLFPEDADFNSSTAEIMAAHPDDRFNPANGYYGTYSNNFRDHTNE